MQERLMLITEPELTNLITKAINKAFETLKAVQEQKGEEWLTFDEACKYLGVSKPTLRKLTKGYKLTAYPVGRQIRYNKQELDQSIKSKSLKGK
ncbi:helix-turn-helix domain-containing protein [Flaviaesturariibacter aridisoli]|uniref:DNA-binding protein n=1 Tax=Flaviaesturariibacter aridisoli TaxID=2545761 RepID=A0A4R4E3F6_9BACT|nr:helix-turn-helix domain-containing protein [Flaviaesturariibacter aridisoli]TCZ73457.1 DNA-binding protein [Flaviaesturariibacter aridisoli]